MLDTPYCLHGRMVTSIKSSHSMAVFAGGKAFELSLDLFQVLMTFAEKKTPRQAFAVLDTDVNLDSFREIVSEFVERGLLRHPAQSTIEAAFGSSSIQRSSLNPLRLKRLPSGCDKVVPSLSATPCRPSSPSASIVIWIGQLNGTSWRVVTISFIIEIA